MWGTVLGSAATFLVTLLTAIFVIPKLRIKQTSDAGDICRIMVGVFKNYARHGLANARALINKDDIDTNSLKILLLRQKYDQSNYERYKKSVDLLFPSDVVSMTGHFSLLTRNINETVDFLTGQDSVDLTISRGELFARNVRVAKLSDVIAELFFKIQNSYFPPPKKVEAKIGVFSVLPDERLSYKTVLGILKRQIKNIIYILVYQNTQISFHEWEREEIGDINTVEFEDLAKLCTIYNRKILELAEERRPLVESLLDPREVS